MMAGSKPFYVVIAVSEAGIEIVSRTYVRLANAIKLVKIILDARPDYYTVTVVRVGA